jgi:hypothetical protein
MLARVKTGPRVGRPETEAFLNEAAGLFRRPRPDRDGPLTFGVDLGTATIVITALDAAGRPIYWDSASCEAVRDGVVVNFADAVAAVRKLAAAARASLGVEILAAATAHPPGVPSAEARACRYVLENAGITCRNLVDEVSAAQALLAIRDGAIVDVGGGSTGVGIVRDGKLIALNDAAGVAITWTSSWPAPCGFRSRRQSVGSVEATRIIPRSSDPASSVSRVRSRARSGHEPSKPFISPAARFAFRTPLRSSRNSSEFRLSPIRIRIS